MCIFSITSCADKIRKKYLDDPDGIGRTDVSSYFYTQLINLCFSFVVLLIFFLF